MNVHLIFDSGWGLGDLLAVDAALTAFSKKYGSFGGVKYYAEGFCGDLKFRQDLVIIDRADALPDHIDQVFRFKTYKNSDLAEYSKLESLTSHLDHMASYMGIDRCGETPVIWGITTSTTATMSGCDIPLSDHGSNWGHGPVIAVCVDGIDVRRHYPYQNWVKLLKMIRRNHPKIRLIQVGHGLSVKKGIIKYRVIRSSLEDVFDETYVNLTTHDTAKILAQCNYFLGSNSGLYQYAQALKVPSMVVFGMHDPVRYTFFNTTKNIYVQNPRTLPCIGCSNRAFETILQERCVAKNFARCMMDITPEYFYAQIFETLAGLEFIRRS